jgi:hypothetical protein
MSAQSRADDIWAAVPRWVALCLGGGATALSLAGLEPGAIYAIAASAVFAAGMVPTGMLLVIGGASLPVHRAHAVS